MTRNIQINQNSFVHLRTKPLKNLSIKNKHLQTSIVYSSNFSGQYSNLLKLSIRNTIDEALSIIFRWLPDDYFERYCSNRVFVIDHGLDHALEVLSIAYRLINKFDAQAEFKFINEPLLIYATLFHDICNIKTRYKHHSTSSNWASAILSTEIDNNPSFCIRETDKEKICEIIRGHKKITEPNSPRAEHKHPESRILHDADLISATLSPRRIYNTWLNWSIEESYNNLKDEEQGKSKPWNFYYYQTPLTVNKFYNKKEKIKNRKLVIEGNIRYSKSDGLTDLFVKNYYRAQPIYYQNFYLTNAGKKFVKEKKIAIDSIIEFLSNEESSMSKTFNLQKCDFRKMKRILYKLTKSHLTSCCT